MNACCNLRPYHITRIQMKLLLFKFARKSKTLQRNSRDSICSNMRWTTSTLRNYTNGDNYLSALFGYAIWIITLLWYLDGTRLQTNVLGCTPVSFTDPLGTARFNTPVFYKDVPRLVPFKYYAGKPKICHHCDVVISFFTGLKISCLSPSDCWSLLVFSSK